MQYVPVTDPQISPRRWHGLTLIAVSCVLFALLVAFGEPWGLPLALRVTLTAFTGISFAVGQLRRGQRA